MSLADVVNYLVDFITPSHDARNVQLELFLARTLGNNGVSLLEASEQYAQAASVRGAAVGALLGMAFAGLSGSDTAYAAMYGAVLAGTAYRLFCYSPALPYLYHGEHG